MKNIFVTVIALTAVFTGFNAFAKVTLEDVYKHEAKTNNAHLGSAPVGPLDPSAHGIIGGLDSNELIWVPLELEGCRTKRHSMRYLPSVHLTSNKVACSNKGQRAFIEYSAHGVCDYKNHSGFNHKIAVCL